MNYCKLTIGLYTGVSDCLKACFWLLLTACAMCVGFPPVLAVEEPRFERDIVPILKTHCFSCHGADKRKGGLDLRTVGSVAKGGAGGAVVIGGKPEESVILKRVAAGEMPPDTARKLSPAEVSLVRDWILAGLPADNTVSDPSPESSPISDEDRRFWAFQPLERPRVPILSDAGRMRTPIDTFVQSRLAEDDLSFSPDADPLVLLRRVHFDLIGLPPSPEDVDAYLNDTASDAYERLVDRLLDSPHFGERWGRHWLDIVGYTDTVSYDGDTTLVAGFVQDRWRFRDYVIHAFNNDKPYDRFLTEQIAGDELVEWRDSSRDTPEVIETLAATGFWRNAEDRSESARELAYKWAFLHDTMETFGTSVMGLTLRCARCHDHKHEPIPQADYYRLLSLITPAFNIQDWKDPKIRAVPAVSPARKAEIDAVNTEIDKCVAEFQTQIEAAKRPCELRLRDAKLALLPEPVREDTKVALETKLEARNKTQEYLAAMVAVKPDEVEASLTAEEQSKIGTLTEAIASENRRRETHGWIHAVYDVGTPPPTQLLIRGEFTNPGSEVQPGFVSVLSTEDLADADPIQPLPASSGRRTALAGWLTKPDTRASGLVARVFVNRVWQHLTGVGIVASSDNLGTSGTRPTHPQLLEWLAVDFVDNGWRIKSLIRQIMLSTVYRQASRCDNDRASNGPDPQEIDPENHLLWHARLRRLESESIRDAMLIASGRFNASMGGAPVPLDFRRDGVVRFDEQNLSDPNDKWRRSLYLFQRRAYHLTMLSVFDQPVIVGSVCRRSASAVALQSLSMMNDRLALELAEQFAEHLGRLVKDSRDKKIEMAFRIAIARRPVPSEIEWCVNLLNQQTERYQSTGVSYQDAEQKAVMHLCRVLFNSSEFLYIE